MKTDMLGFKEKGKDDSNFLVGNRQVDSGATSLNHWKKKTVKFEFYMQQKYDEYIYLSQKFMQSFFVNPPS